MKIIIAAGGSGGHIFPAIALARKLEQRKDIDIIFAASKRALDTKILERVSYRKYMFSINPMPYRFDLKVIPFLVKMVYDIFLSIFLLVYERPRVVIGFGGYTSGTIVAISSLLGIKTIIHEQNLIPGRANRILDRFAASIAVSFEQSRKYFKNKRIVITGNPLRENIMILEKDAALKALGLEKGRFTILVMGGSQGAHSLNTLVSEAVIELPERIISKIQVLHIAGPVDENEIRSIYEKHGVVSNTFSFIDNIHDAYNSCDMAVSRAGAATIFELALYARPMILIPYPSKRNNQRFNARFFADHGAALYGEEETLNSDDVRVMIKNLFEDENRRRDLSRKAAELSGADAAGKLAAEVISHL